ncbi:MAG: ABC transporter ATP-binding protein [Solobacterium sp.]|nr:ABC transporter ATP-binding protein/permease [Solobacterium sp.]MDD7776672.1 ABC transporter ATP-binding protein [Solobacterium sp.]MDY2953753.1 ABC transporter ATP-binding protein [Erysipelotrichaceae bacterium]
MIINNYISGEKLGGYFCVLTATLEVLLNLTQLYIAPGIIKCVEQKTSIKVLLMTILAYTLALFVINGFKKYIEENTLFARIEVRTKIIAMVSRKCNTTSYPNTLDANFIRLRDAAYFACEGNSEATEHIWQTLTMLLKNIGGLIAYLFILSSFDSFLLLVVILTCFISFFVSRHANNWHYANKAEGEKYYHKKRYIRDKAESIKLAKDIRIFNLKDWLNELLDLVHNQYLAFRLKGERVDLLADVTEVVLTVIRNGIAYIYLINMTLNDGLSVSSFVLYFVAISTLTNWVMGVLKEMSTLHKECLDISSLREFLDYPEPFKFDDGKDIPLASNYEIKLENVSFHYPESDKDIIHNLDLTIHPREKLAIVGLNGAGKTTLVKLICGLLSPSEGRVLLNGDDFSDFNRNKYYELFSAVFQDFSILDVTIAEEIAQCKDNIDYQRIKECIDYAGLTDTIDKLPKGLDTHIGREVYLDGVLLSGGQMQRLMLARALYKNGPILLLDEPTAALDPLAESEIYQKYSDMANNKTSLFISHRLASTRFCDRIILIEDGGVKEEGSHEDLLKLDGEYAKLFEVQSRYYKQGKEI